MRITINQQGVQGALSATPEKVRKAEVRALKKIGQYAGSQVARGIAAAERIPLRTLTRGRAGKAGRLRVRVPETTAALKAQVWIGTNPVKASYLGKPRQTKAGARAGQHAFPGAFVATMKSGHVGIFKRAHGSRKLDEQVIRLQSAQSVVDKVLGPLPERHYALLMQELNYELRVRGGR